MLTSAYGGERKPRGLGKNVGRMAGFQGLLDFRENPVGMLELAGPDDDHVPTEPAQLAPVAGVVGDVAPAQALQIQDAGVVGRCFIRDELGLLRVEDMNIVL